MEFITLAAAYEEEYLNKVQRILRIPSVFEKDDHYPFGKSIDDALQEMLAIAGEDGFQVKNVSGYAGHIEWGQGDELIGILGHLDVVPPGEGWTSDPFKPIIEDGKVYARGAQDDKGPVMAAYIAMKLLKDNGFQPKKRVRIILGTDEERDWQGIDYYFKHEEMPQFGFSPDAAFPVVHAEKGLIDGYLNLPSLSLTSDAGICVSSIVGGDRLNMVPDHAKAVLNTADREQVISSFYAYLEASGLSGHLEVNHNHIELEIRGKGVHASKPENGINAVVELVKFLTRLPLSPDSKKVLSWLADSFGDTSGNRLGIGVRDQVSGSLTVNLGSLRYEENLLTAGVNIRYPVTSDGEAIIKTLKEKSAKWQGTYSLYDHLKPLYIDERHPGVSTLLDTFNRHTGSECNAEAIGGATYARALEAGVAYGAMLPDSPDTAHQANEHVRIDDMMKAIAIYAEAIYHLTK